MLFELVIMLYRKHIICYSQYEEEGPSVCYKEKLIVSKT